MKKTILLMLIFLFALCKFECSYAQDDLTLADESCYKTYKRVNYQSLPEEIKKLMKDSKCGEIDATPSQSNGYLSNYDEGYVIDLNDDKVLEYVFSCVAPPHGPGEGKIYSKISGKWKIISPNFYVMMTGVPQKDIKILPTKTNGFYDIYDVSISKAIKYKDGMYQ